MRRKFTTLVVAAAAVFAVTACNADYAQGPAGRVVDKDRDYVRSGKHGGTWKFELTVRTASGEQTEFRVDRDTYKGCVRGSSYPNCANGRG